MISDGTLTTIWDRAGRILSYDGHSCAYDGEGRRIAQTAGGSTTRYVLDVQRRLPAVIGAKAGSDITHYMHGPLGMFAQRNPDASWDWMLHDGLGSVRGVFDGTLQSAAEYDPFGEPIVAPIGTAYGFTGELTDGNGLVYLRARYLAASLGTFASRDPWRGSASAPRTWNGYAWVEGNVINRVDPGGMQSITSSPTPTPTVSCPQTPQPVLVSTPPVATSTPDPTLVTAAVLQQTATPTAPNGLTSRQPEMVPTPAGDYLEEYWAREKLRGNPDVVGFLAALTGGLILTGAAIVAWPVVGPALAAAARFVVTNPIAQGATAAGGAELLLQVASGKEVDLVDVALSTISGAVLGFIPVSGLLRPIEPVVAREIVRLNLVVAVVTANEELQGDYDAITPIVPGISYLQQFLPDNFGLSFLLEVLSGATNLEINQE